MDTAIDIGTITAAYDHDKNVHTGDIGQDYLLDLLPYEDSDAFVEDVHAMRDGERDPAQIYPADEPYSAGEELGIMLAEHEVEREDVLAHVETAGFRDGFRRFLQDSLAADSPTYIISAGDEDFLTAVYEEAGLMDDRLTICGTRQYWDQDGASAGIMYGNGRAKKGERLETEMLLDSQLEEDDPYGPLVASGDSDGDARLLEAAREQGGLAIATGPEAGDHADVIVEGPGWYGQIAATLAVAGQETGLDRETIVSETRNYLGQFDIPATPTVRPGAYAHEDRNGIEERGETVTEIVQDVFR